MKAEDLERLTRELYPDPVQKALVKGIFLARATAWEDTYKRRARSEAENTFWSETRANVEEQLRRAAVRAEGMGRRCVSPLPRPLQKECVRVRVGTPGFQGARLTEAREARAITGKDLAATATRLLRESGRAAVISPQQISQYEHGQGTPHPDTLEVVARVLGVPAAFFMLPPRECPEETIFYRKMSAATKKARTRAQWQFQWLKDIHSYLSGFVEFPQMNLPEIGLSRDPLQISHEDVEYAARQARIFWHMGDAPVGNMVRLLENQGVVVGRQEMGAATLDGLSARDTEGGHAYVLLGTDKGTAVRWRFDAAHELGHLILHRGVQKNNLGDAAAFGLIEEQAHHFARAFLLPLDPFSEDFFSAQLDVLRAMKPKWRVSIAAMIMRARDANLVNEDTERRLWMNLNRRKWRNEEPYDREWSAEEPLVTRQALEMVLSSGMQTVDDLLSAVHLYATDVEHTAGLPNGYLGSHFTSLRMIPRAEAQQREGGPAAEVIPFIRKQSDQNA